MFLRSCSLRSYTTSLKWCYKGTRDLRIGDLKVKPIKITPKFVQEFSHLNVHANNRFKLTESHVS